MSGPPVLIPPIERHVDANHVLHPDNIWIRMVRVAVGAAVLAALMQKTYDATVPGNDVDVVQLYSEFTVQSNLALGIGLAVAAALPRTKLPPWWDHVFGALVL